MKRSTRKLKLVEDELAIPSLGALIHDRVRKAIEQALEEELTAALGATSYQRTAARLGDRNGSKARTLTTQVGPVELDVPRATMRTPGGTSEWRPRLLPRYARRVREVNEAIAGVYLSGVNTRRLRGALRPLLKAAPLSRSAVSRVVATLKGDLEAWKRRSLAKLDVAYLYLDAIALRVRTAGKVTSVPVLAAIVVLTDGHKQLVALELCGGESHAAWKGFLDDLVARGLKAPKLCIVDGNAGLGGALALVWPGAPVQRCTVHKLRNLKSKAPLHAHDELGDDYHRIVYAATRAEARTEWDKFTRKWDKACPAVVRSLEEAGDELLTFMAFPSSQWRSLRTTNVIERVNEEFRRRVKTQGSFPTEDSAMILLFSLVASGQIVLRRLDGWEDIVHVVSAPPAKLAA